MLVVVSGFLGGGVLVGSLVFIFPGMPFPLILKVSGSLNQLNHTPGCTKPVQSEPALVYTESDARNKTTKSQRGILELGVYWKNTRPKIPGDKTVHSSSREDII